MTSRPTLSPAHSSDRTWTAANGAGSRPLTSPSPSNDRFTFNSGRNPLSLRLYKSLSSNFQDAASREALETLSALYSPETSTTASPSRVAAEKDGDTSSDSEDEDDTDAPSTSAAASSSGFAKSLGLTSLSGDISIAESARKNSRRDIEQQLITSSIRFLHAFGDVNKKLDALQLHMDEMTARCDEAQSELSKTSESSKQLLEKAGGLRAQRQNTLVRQDIINTFLSRFTLTDAEIESITSHDVPVGKQLFSAMDRAEKIRSDCRILLRGEDGAGTKAGLDIMSRTADQLDAAYDKVQRWCSFEFRQLGKDSHLEVSPVMREAVLRLRNRPDVLSAALTDLTTIRQSALLNQFTTALTRGGPSGLPRPIELHAHDPIRYVGDMLAWVHQAMATEREFLDALFGLHHERRMVGSSWRRDVGAGGEGKAESEEAGWVRELMDRDLEKLCTPLQVRVQQTIKSQEGSITAYKISNLLSFYLVTMRRTIGEEALLTQTLQGLTDLSKQVFGKTIDSQGRSLLRYLHPPEQDLSPPLALRDVSQVLRDIMSVYDSSMLEIESGSAWPRSTDGNGNAPVENPERVEFNNIMDAAVQPALEMCRRMADLKKDGGLWEKEIFLVNCVAYLQGTFHPFSFAESKVAELDRELQAHLNVLVQEHYKRVLGESGLSGVIDAIESQPSDTPLSRLPASSPTSLSTALSKFDAFLSTLDVLSSPRLSLLLTPTLASSIHRSALRQIGLAYGKVCDAVRDGKNKYEFATTVLGTKRPFGQMGVLWQVLGVAPE